MSSRLGQTSARNRRPARWQWVHPRLTPWGLICQSDSHLTRMQARSSFWSGLDGKEDPGLAEPARLSPLAGVHQSDPRER